jgi:hypothetical protein
MSEDEKLRFDCARELVELMGNEIIKYTLKSRSKARELLESHLNFIDGKITLDEYKLFNKG